MPYLRPLLPFLLCFAPFVWADTQRVCDRFQFEGNRLNLSEAEQEMICGSEDTPGWKNVPLPQAVFHLRSFLQDRGYFNPPITEKDGWLVVPLSSPLRVRELIVKGELPEGIRPTRMRHVRGEVLTPALLDEVKSRLQRQLEFYGYPCAQIDLKGNTDNGDVTVTVDRGALHTIQKFSREPIEGISPEALSRFDAFHLGDTYDKRNTMVTSQRILDVSLVQSAFFTFDCRNGELHQAFVPGPPRLFSLGVGFDTEQLGLLRASWRNSRIGAHSSQFQTVAAVSFRQQEWNFDLKAFPTLNWPRTYLRSSLGFKRENYDPYDRLSIRTRFAPGFTWDNATIGFDGSVGPALTVAHTRRGQGARDAKLLSLSGLATLRSHQHEFYRNSPTAGFETTLDFDLSEEDVASPVTAYRTRLTFEKHWNIAHFEPPLLVFSIRGGLQTTFTQRLVNDSKVPNEYRFFLGGSTDVRGFSIRELPGNDFGAFTATFLGAEARFPDILPWNLQPFLLTDAAMLGDRPLSLSGPLYWSPGVGIRWQSPIGVIRVNLAKGMISDEALTSVRPHWQFYFSYGEEF